MGANSPFAYVASLAKMATKVKDHGTMVWLFAGIVDSVKMGFSDMSAFSVRNLSLQTGNNNTSWTCCSSRRTCGTS